MSLYKVIIAVFVASCLMTGFACAQSASSTSVQSETPSFSTDVTALEATLKVRLDQFETIFVSENISKLSNFTPPKVLNQILSSANVTRAQLDAQVDQVWKMTLQFVEIGEFEIDNTARSVEFLDNGRPYKILPTTTKMKLKANKSEIVSRSETLALVADGEWYIVRLDEPAQVKIFRAEYPDFDNVEVMEPVMLMDGKEVTR